MTDDAPNQATPNPASIRRARTILCAAILAIGAAAFVTAVATGARDSAVLFVGVPTALALAVAVARPSRSLHGTVFKAISIGLLMAAVWLHEGAICVLFAAPLIFGIGHGVTAIAQAARKRTGTYALIPLILLSSLEGTTPQWRIEPVQTVTVTRVTAAATDTVAARIAHGPVAREPRPLLLRLGIPLPATVSGVSLGPGAQWTFCYHGDAHGDGGQIVTSVAESAPGRVTFRVVSDTTITARWLAMRDAELTWHATGDGRTEVTLRMTFRRGLDPSWYFGPIEDAFVTAAAEHLLDTLDIS